MKKQQQKNMVLNLCLLLEKDIVKQKLTLSAIDFHSGIRKIFLSHRHENACCGQHLEAPRRGAPTTHTRREIRKLSLPFS